MCMKARPSAKVPAKHYKELYTLITALENDTETEALLKDLLTRQELDSLADRWQEIQLLAKGIPQRNISEKLNISISKITRGSQALQYGTGGFKKMLMKLGKPIKNFSGFSETHTYISSDFFACAAYFRSSLPFLLRCGQCSGSDADEL